MGCDLASRMGKGAADKVDNGRPIDADDKGRQGKREGQRAMDPGDMEGRGVLCFIKEHLFKNSRVVVKGDRRVEDTNDGEHEVEAAAFFKHSGKEVKFADKARQGWKAGEGEKKNGHDDSEKRCSAT